MDRPRAGAAYFRLVVGEHEALGGALEYGVLSVGNNIMNDMDVTQRMREEWNRRAREDAYFYAAFGRRHQGTREFLASGLETVTKFQDEFIRLPPGSPSSRRALEIGCGPGRLMLPMSKFFGEIHGVDISDEMVRIARKNLKEISHALVHVTPDSSLTMFPAEYFDFVYSYIAFQHMPERTIVINYLRESHRVLKPGGVLCCQIRGAPPIASEMKRESSTWTGCFFGLEELRTLSRENDFHLVAISGLDTQYLWATWVKPLPETDTGSGTGFVLKSVTAASNAQNVVPERGPEAAVSLWIDGLPARCHLANLEVCFDGIPGYACYISPIGSSGACQLNARLPAGIRIGPVSVSLLFEGKQLGMELPIEVVRAPPLIPRIVSVSDGINVASKGRVETGGIKVMVENVAHPEEVSFTVAGFPAEFLQFECKEPITKTYEFAFQLSHKVRRGNRLLKALAGEHQLPPESVEVAGVAGHAPDGKQHHTTVGDVVRAAFSSSVKQKRKLAAASARWFNNKKG